MKYIEAITKSSITLLASTVPAMIVGMALNDSVAVYSVLVMGAFVSALVGISHCKEYE